MSDCPPVAEVIASSTREVVAEVYDPTAVPAFGSWVEVETESGAVLYGLVSHAETGAVEPGRQAVALGPGYDRETLRREMPQLQALIRTVVRVQILAYWDGRARHREGPQASAPLVRQTLPPQPAALHDRVHACADETVARFGAPFDYVRTLARNPDPAVPADDLLAAALGGLYRAYGQGEAGKAVLIAAGRALARLLDDDHERLQSILRRVG